MSPVESDAPSAAGSVLPHPARTAEQTRIEQRLPVRGDWLLDPVRFRPAPTELLVEEDFV